MANKPREKFDWKREFTVNKPFKFSGQTLAPGVPFDKTTASTRRLRQLYDNLYINMQPKGYQPVGSGEVPLSIMTEEQLREWLDNHGVIARRNADRAKLLQQAERVLVSA